MPAHMRIRLRRSGGVYSNMIVENDSRMSRSSYGTFAPTWSLAAFIRWGGAKATRVELLPLGIRAVVGLVRAAGDPRRHCAGRCWLADRPASVSRSGPCCRGPHRRGGWPCRTARLVVASHTLARRLVLVAAGP